MKHVQGSRGKKNCKLLIGTTKISFRFEQLATGLFSSGKLACMYVCIAKCPKLGTATWAKKSR